MVYRNNRTVPRRRRVVRRATTTVSSRPVRRNGTRYRRTAVTRTLINRTVGTGRAFRQGSIKAHHFMDRGISCANLYPCTTSQGAGPPINFTWTWGSNNTYNQIQPSSTNSGFLYCWLPSLFSQSVVYISNRSNYNWVKPGKMIMHWRPQINAQNGPSTPASSINNGQYLLSNYKIPIEYCATPSGGTTWTGNVTSVIGNMGLMLNNYANFFDDPNTKKRSILKGDHVQSHTFVRNPTCAYPVINSISQSGSTVNPTNDWNLSYNFTAAKKMSTANMDNYYYPPVCIYLPGNSSGTFGIPFSCSWSTDFWLIDPN